MGRGQVLGPRLGVAGEGEVRGPRLGTAEGEAPGHELGGSPLGSGEALGPWPGIVGEVPGQKDGGSALGRRDGGADAGADTDDDGGPEVGDE
jgi:hypothetical protein